MKTLTAIIIAGLILGGAVLLSNNLGRSSSQVGTVKKDTQQVAEENIQNVNIVDGKQIIEIRAKGGYSPRVSTAKAGIPTILRFNTNGTFDCSASVRIPSMNISEMLTNTGTKDIPLGSPKVGTLQGTCGMGMYPFEINFRN